MNDWDPTANDLFVQALEYAADSERRAFVANACDGNAKLETAVLQLLEAHYSAGSFLEGNAIANPDGRLSQKGAGNGSEACQSVLSLLRSQLVDLPTITLREENEEYSVHNPSSKELPVTSEGSKHQVHGEIARGGMGVVLKGRDSDLGRDLAIKVLLNSHLDQPEMVERFVEEAQIGGQLQHPGIVPVYELGRFQDSRPFFTMKLIKGKTLATLLSDRKNPTDDQPKLLGIFEQVCQTVAYAHTRGVIHRDVKPANIMVGAFGEVQVMDWGLAKVLAEGGVADEKRAKQEREYETSAVRTHRSEGSDSPEDEGSETRMGSIMGTPAYMSPEQACGEIDRLDERTDVFALGAILYEILTGESPFGHVDNVFPTRDMMCRQLEDCLERLKSTDVDQELITMVSSALAPEKKDRPKNAGVLADAVSAYQVGVQERLKTAELRSVEASARAIEEKRRRKLYILFSGVMFCVAITAIVSAKNFLNLSQQLTEERNNAIALLDDLRIEREERIFTAILAGDESAAKEAILLAEKVGMTQTQRDLYLGQLSLYYGRPEEAMNILRNLSDESVAALGLLSVAASFTLDYSVLDATISELDKRVNEQRDTLTFADKLFAGQAMINGDMIIGMELVEEALQERPTSPLAQMIRSMALTAFAHNTGDRAKMLPALQSIKDAMRWGNRTPCTMTALHMVQKVALTFGMEEDVGIDIEQLHQEWNFVRDVPMGRLMLVRLLALLEDPTLPQRIMDEGKLLAAELDVYAPILLVTKSPDDVLELVNKHLGSIDGFTAARLMALVGPRPVDARAICREVIRKDRNFVPRNMCLQTLLLLGEVESVPAIARDAIDSSINPYWYAKETQLFLTDPNAIDDYLAGAEPILVHQAEAEFTIGVLLLGQGQQELARRRFENCIRTNATHWENYWWARAFVFSMSGKTPWEIPQTHNN